MSKTQGEGRAPNEKSQRYVDPNLRKRKIKEQRDLTARFNDLCGEVTITRITDDITMSHVPKYRTCGGCKGLGSHQRWCVESVGPVASMRGRQAQDAEDLGDAVGSNNMHAANLLYQAGALLLEQAKTEAALFQEQQADIAMSHVPGMLTK